MKQLHFQKNMEFNDMQEVIHIQSKLITKQSKFHVKIKFEKSEEAFLCYKEIIWWTKVHYSTTWGSLPHIKFSTNYLNESVPDYVRKKNWPPNFCDLNPVDNANCEMMEKMVYMNVKQYEDIKGLSPVI